MAILFAGLFKDMLRHDEAVGYEPPEPVQNVKYIVVAFLLVHGRHDLHNFCVYGGGVAFPPIQERVVACGDGVEVIGTTDCHDMGVVLDECLGNAVFAKQSNYSLDITVSAGVVITKEPDSVGNTEVIME